MGIIGTFILSRSEKHLARYRRDAESVKKELAHEYEAYLPTIERCYDKATYWHGTGRYHYVHSGNSRFFGLTDNERIVDILNSIAESGGLIAHQDLWAGVGKTVSLAPSRMNARLYAHIHLREGVWLKYVFGGTRFWMSFFFMVAFKELFTQLKPGQWSFMRQTVLSPHFFKHMRTWMSAVCNLEKHKVIPVWRAYDLRSDIEGNHSILFGVKKEAVEGKGVMPFLQRLEARTLGGVPFERFTHVEVPQEQVEGVRTFLETRNINLPVIPLEFGELYCSQFSLQQLAHV